MNKPHDLKQVGKRIKEIRISLGLSMDDFAKRIDDKARSGTVANWETGKNLPNNERLKKIAELVNIRPAYLLSGNPYDNLSPEELEEQLQYEFEQQVKEHAIGSFREKKYVQLEDFINAENSFPPRYFYINGHRLDDEAIKMLVKLFEGKEKNYPTEKEIEKEYEKLRNEHLEYLEKKKNNPKMISFGEHHFYKYH
ncbi:helix-turn-helix domain-containing protein [Bacillus ndiopicus]|uniref:helix-turn-helix domain-containing protein n=1 Tax=Bacillus ndiopicus TaxID=1347368 RepID=UPI0009452EA8|nr:helix-turn-helix transcriptional regulator [Bacillus ndiopicus]